VGGRGGGSAIHRTSLHGPARRQGEGGESLVRGLRPSLSLSLTSAFIFHHHAFKAFQAEDFNKQPVLGGSLKLG
jgi:hypothetical protein